MRLMDYFFYKTYLFLIRLKKNQGDAKWSAFLYTGIYATAFFIMALCFIGLWYNTLLSSLLGNKPIIFVIISGILITLLLSLRYYRYVEIDNIESSYNSLKGGKKRIMKASLYIVLFGIPILTFTLFRLYVVGQFKWW